MAHCGYEGEMFSVLFVGAAQQCHGEDDQQDCLLMNMPATQEGGPATQGQTPYELSDVGRTPPHLDQSWQYEQHGQYHGGQWRYVGEHLVLNVLHQSPCAAATMLTHCPPACPPGQQHQGLVSNIVDCPEVGGPVGMTQSSLEWKQSGDHISQVVSQDEWDHGSTHIDHDRQPQQYQPHQGERGPDNVAID